MIIKNWDVRFLKLIINETSNWSKDPSSKVSAIIVDEFNHVKTMSYNGFPRGIDDTLDRLNDRVTKYKLIQHAEMNAISICAKLGIETDNCKIICTHFPCSTCTGAIINAGLKKIVTQTPIDGYLQRWNEDITISKMMIQEAGVELVTMDLNTIREQVYED